MQSNRLKRREFITPRGSAAAPTWPQTSAAPRAHRRELLQSLLVAALASAAGWRTYAAAGAIPLARDRFVELSEKLCALSIDDKALAGAIQNALAEQYGDDEFNRLAALLHSATTQEADRLVAGAGLATLARSIISVWYSGLVGTGENARVLAYEEALAWRATGFAKAPGTCGEFADWAAKPANTLARERRP
jgi:hypothetical protein